MLRNERSSDISWCVCRCVLCMFSRPRQRETWAKHSSFSPISRAHDSTCSLALGLKAVSCTQQHFNCSTHPQMKGVWNPTSALTSEHQSDVNKVQHGECSCWVEESYQRIKRHERESYGSVDLLPRIAESKYSLLFIWILAFKHASKANWKRKWKSFISNRGGLAIVEIPPVKFHRDKSQFQETQYLNCVARSSSPEVKPPTGQKNKHSLE